MTNADQPRSLRQALAASADGQRLLLIAAGTAQPEISAARVFHAAAPARVDVWIAPGASHTGAFRTHRDEWERRVIEFFDDALDPA